MEKELPVSSEQALNDMVKQIEYRISHERVELAEEKLLVRVRAGGWLGTVRASVQWGACVCERLSNSVQLPLATADPPRCVRAAREREGRLRLSLHCGSSSANRGGRGREHTTPPWREP